MHQAAPNRLAGLMAILIASVACFSIKAQHSIAREWNEQVLNAIRHDLARPTVHARNLYHTSVAMYDAWAAYERNADTYLLGKMMHGHYTPFTPHEANFGSTAMQEEALSFAVYRLIRHRFKSAPGSTEIFNSCDKLMKKLGYDVTNTSTQYHCGPAELGNYIADQLIAYGYTDGSNEIRGYINEFYLPVNPPLRVDSTGNPNIVDLNHWQPLELGQFVDQGGNPIGGSVPAFLGAEWGNVHPFSLHADSALHQPKNGHDFALYYNPGHPPYIDDDSATDLSNSYKWAHSLVSVWSSHLNPNDPTKIDISPASQGNIQQYPSNFDDYPNFYNLTDGGDIGTGYSNNPTTGLPYQSNLVKRSDYTRVLAEFWADGPDSETPPGHWFTILNGVNDHPKLERKFMGTGPALDPLEWDVKCYFILGGAMHDAAVVVWGIKGYYDYIRPISAIRGMAEYGQGSDTSLPNYHKHGLPLIPGFIETILPGDSLQGDNQENVGEIKIYAWKGPDYIINEATDMAGVGWILAKDWWPYQRPSFVTPPFAGYVSGHSTFSRTAAEVLTAITGDPYFPGGVGEFHCAKNDFLVFEEGPSEDITLQWATYRDAADQCSLSRIWGGIHPPVDDIPGRIIGMKLGANAFNFALPYFNNTVEDYSAPTPVVFPNPTNCGVFIDHTTSNSSTARVYSSSGALISETTIPPYQENTYIDICGAHKGIYILTLTNGYGELMLKRKIVKY